jgi:hypothetical protein
MASSRVLLATGRGLHVTHAEFEIVIDGIAAREGVGDGSRHGVAEGVLMV